MEGYEQPVVLIAGGRDKSGDFTVLREIVRKKAKAVILIGEAAEKIGIALQDTVRLVRAASLADAVRVSRGIAEAGDVVLLSPACASFDMFRDFEDRGRQFKQQVMELQP
jgi:UDP-N-acetylmuramoylalanine--D-glutamate ligase